MVWFTAVNLWRSLRNGNACGLWIKPGMVVRMTTECKTTTRELKMLKHAESIMLVSCVNKSAILKGCQLRTPKDVNFSCRKPGSMNQNPSEIDGLGYTDSWPCGYPCLVEGQAMASHQKLGDTDSWPNPIRSEQRVVCALSGKQRATSTVSSTWWWSKVSEVVSVWLHYRNDVMITCASSLWPVYSVSLQQLTQLMAWLSTVVGRTAARMLGHLPQNALVGFWISGRDPDFLSRNVRECEHIYAPNITNSVGRTSQQLAHQISSFGSWQVFARHMALDFCASCYSVNWHK